MFSHVLRYVFGLGVLLIGLSACGSSGESRLRPKPAAFGSINQVTVLADTNLITTDIRDSLAFFFESPYIILPQPEPIFDLDFTSIWELEARPVKRQLRTFVVLANLDDEFSRVADIARADLNAEQLRKAQTDGFVSAVASNKWANGQKIYYFVGRDLQALRKGLSRTYSTAVRAIKAAQMDRWNATAFAGGGNGPIQADIRNWLGVSMRVPRNYKLAPLSDTSVVWARNLIEEGSLNLFLSTVPYENAQQLTEEGFKAIINEEAGRYISSDLDGTYFQIYEDDLPTFINQTEINGKFALEAHGIWEMKGRFMAGSMVAYLVLDEADEQLVLAMGILHAPNEDKRDRMETLDAVLRTLEVD